MKDRQSAGLCKVWHADPPPSKRITSKKWFWMVRSVLNRAGKIIKKFSDFYFSSYHRKLGWFFQKNDTKMAITQKIKIGKIWKLIFHSIQHCEHLKCKYGHFRGDGDCVHTTMKLLSFFYLLNIITKLHVIRAHLWRTSCWLLVMIHDKQNFSKILEHQILEHKLFFGEFFSKFLLRHKHFHTFTQENIYNFINSNRLINYIHSKRYINELH